MMYELIGPFKSEEEPEITLAHVWADYQVTRKLRATTVKNYSQRLNRYLGDWLHRPVCEITKDEIEERHHSIPGDAMANSTMRTLRALLHYAMFKYVDAKGDPVIKVNPVRRLSEVRAWHRDKRRRDVIAATDLKAWFQAVYSLDSLTFRDFLITMILTGMRKNEAVKLTWDRVDTEAGIIKLLDIHAKNGEGIELPMSDYLRSLLITRRFAARNIYVFPAPHAFAPMCASHKTIREITKRCGVKFSLHTLRRTFATTADDLDIKSEVVKNLLNHKSSDVTEGYTVRSIERLRRATQKISDQILTLGGIRRDPYNAARLPSQERPARVQIIDVTR